MESTNNAGAMTGPKIRVLAQYTKALSFVSKEGAQVNGMAGTPNIDLGIDLSNEPISGQPHVYETTLKLMARAHVEDDTMFEIDLAYAGIFDLNGSPTDIHEPVLMIDCPTLLFPYARQIITDVSREGGFPPLMVDPIDFAGLYRQQLDKAAQS